MNFMILTVQKIPEGIRLRLEKGFFSQLETKNHLKNSDFFYRKNSHSVENSKQGVLYARKTFRFQSKSRGASIKTN